MGHVLFDCKNSSRHPSISSGLPRMRWGNMGDLATDDILIERRGALHVVTLNRPRALNALTCDMRAQISRLLPQIARDPMSYALAIRSGHERVFSAGGDVREILDLHQREVKAGRKAFSDEYYLNWQHECFSKPTLSLINGLVMGSGVGVTAYGTHRIAGENYRFAMPETAIGLFPDVGVCHLLARMPDHIGLYLGLSGRRIGRADAYALELVTHCIDATHFDGIIEEVADVQPVDPVLDGRHQHPGEPELNSVRDLIRHCFSAGSVEAIISRLRAVSGSNKEWAEQLEDELRQKSPLALKVTYAHIKRVQDMDLRQTLLADYALAARFLDGREFREGVRAALIDKDNAPNWQPPELSDVGEDLVSDMLQPLPGQEFMLPTRAEMQAARS